MTEDDAGFTAGSRCRLDEASSQEQGTDGKPLPVRFDKKFFDNASWRATSTRRNQEHVKSP